MNWAIVIPVGKWYIEDGRPAADTPYGAVKFWAPLLEPPEVVK